METGKTTLHKLLKEQLIKAKTLKLRRCGAWTTMAAAASSTCLPLLLILLCFSHLIFSSKAIPISRTMSLVHKFQGDKEVSETAHMENLEKKPYGVMRRRMEVELNDYPGAGSNNRHTPKPQLGRGCVDC